MGANLRNTVNPEKLLLIVITDRKECIHHTIHQTCTYRHCKTNNKTTNKNGLRAIKPRQRPNKSPTNHLYTKPSNQSTHPQSIRRLSRLYIRVQPCVYTMHQNPSYGFPRVKNVIGVNLRNTVNPEKLLLIVITDRKVDIHHTIHLTYTYRHYKTIKKNY